MIKMIALLKRKDHLTYEEFIEHWTEIHAPLAYDVPGIRRYVQNHIVTRQSRADIPDIPVDADGVAELWFDDAAAMAKVHGTPQMQRLLADGATFIGQIRTFIVEEKDVPLAGVDA
ncbi:EthD domain-containing protein [Enterovirga rhinocerotis]|uniref:Uncharacterized protein (TIGR02118 family) n=1 Tax=Enterovirga rhinocerotis TaxID=1339210 RepID=A0A4R7BXX1_9HYPH|nr:EthD domain-containing protein [Enterovirga rhinocerotis]TDR90373.1 uncharacterized protein (TIGR02118 family) [Enterovirga rhinocerotis]